MKILLLNMPVKFNSWQNLEMPLGIAYIASELEKHGHNVEIIDYEVEPFGKIEFQNILNSSKPEVIGVSFRSSSYASAKNICSLIRQTNPDIKIALGGHHATAFPEDTLKDMNADFIVRQEGEYVMARLLEALNGDDDLDKIKALTYRKGEMIINNEPGEFIEDLDALSFPAWHLLPIERYVTGSILTSRGCPFSCIYCDKGISTRKVRFRSPQNIYQEIVAFEERYKKRRIYFVDDYFLLNKNRLLEIFNLITRDERLRFKWYCQARVDGVDSEILDSAKKSGCEMITFGIETGDKDELNYINKKATLEQAQRAITLAKNEGIKTRANFMIGFPISTPKTIGNSIRFAKIINADLYRFFIVSPLPNTVLWDRVEALHPEITQIGWDKFDFYSPSFDTVEIKKEDLIKYVMASYLYVLRDKIIWELTIGFVPRGIKLLYLSLRSRRIRGNLSIAFPACVNLFLESWFIIRNLKKGDRLNYIKAMFKLAASIKNG